MNNEIDDPQMRRKCTELIRTLFSIECPNFGKLRSVRGGSNLHVRLDLESNTFGFKTWSAALEVDGWEAGCAERERLMNSIARVLQLPHVCEAVQTKELDFGQFEGHIVSVSRWLMDGREPARTFSALTDEERHKIIADDVGFFRQYGQWASFAVAFDFRDWTAANFVWSFSKKVISLIDSDWCMGKGLDRNRNAYLAPINVFKPIDESMIQSCAEHLTAGIADMQVKLKERAELVAEVLSDASIREHRQYKPDIKSDLSTEASEKFYQLMR